MPDTNHVTAPDRAQEGELHRVEELVSPSLPLPRHARLASLVTKHHDFLLLLLLFAVMRFMALLFIDQNGPLGAGTAHDYWFYRSFADLSARGQYPFVDYWLEYQPVFAWLVVGVYKLSLLIPPYRSHLLPFYLLLGGVSMLADVGNLALVYLISRRWRGATVGLRAALIYALLVLPLYVAMGWFDSVPTFLLLASLYLLLTGHPKLSALVGGVGFMTKLLPALVVPVALRVLGRWRDRVIYVVVWSVTVAAIAAPFLVVNPVMLVASFRAALFRSSWETIWALMEGYYGVGLVAELGDHFRPETADWQAHPSTLPWLWITLAFAVVGGFVFLRRADWREPNKAAALSAFTVGLFFLWSKGYSPQFAVYVLPFLIILMPNMWGVVLALLYSLTNFLTFPLYELLFTEQPWVLWLATLGRTLILAIMTVESAALLYPAFHLRLSRARDRLVKPAAAGVILLLLIGSVVLYRAYVDQGDYYILQRFVQPLSTRHQAVIVSSSEAYAFAHARLPDADYYIVPESWATHMDQMLQELAHVAEGAPQTWLILDGVRGDDGRFGLLQSTLQKYGAQATNTWFDTFRLVNVVAPTGAAETVPDRTAIQARFGDSLELESVGLSATNVSAGGAVRLVMQWKASRPPGQDLSLFVHLLLPDGRVGSQVDMPLNSKGASSSRWSAGDVVETVANLPVPFGAPPVQHKVIMGLYDPKSGGRLHVSSPQGPVDSIELGALHVSTAPFVRAKKLGVQPIVEFPEGFAVRAAEAPTEIRPGGMLQVNLLWQMRRASRSDLVATYQLVDDQGRVVAQQTGAPATDAYPTSHWPVGEIVRDPRHLLISPDARPGLYRLVVSVSPVGAASGTDSGADSPEVLRIKVLDSASP